MNENGRQNNQEQTQDIGQLMKVRRDKLAELQAEGENPFDVTTYNQEYHTSDIIENFDKMDGRIVSIAGRLMSKRVMGKASFFDLRDREGKVQLYVTRDDMGEEVYKKFKRLDLRFVGTICMELSNGEVSYVSRRYVSKIKRVLGL